MTGVIALFYVCFSYCFFLSLKQKRIKIHNLNYEKKGRGVSSRINVSRNRFKEFEDAWVLLEM